MSPRAVCSPVVPPGVVWENGEILYLNVTLRFFFSQKCQTPAECVVNVFTAECKVWWYCTYTAMSAVVFQGHRSPLAFLWIYYNIYP